LSRQFVIEIEIAIEIGSLSEIDFDFSFEPESARGSLSPILVIAENNGQPAIGTPCCLDTGLRRRVPL
jgi:hypothetical protein